MVVIFLILLDESGLMSLCFQVLVNTSVLSMIITLLLTGLTSENQTKVELQPDSWNKLVISFYHIHQCAL